MAEIIVLTLTLRGCTVYTYMYLYIFSRFSHSVLKPYQKRGVGVKQRNKKEMHSPSPLSTHPRPIFHPMVYISNVKKHHIEINAPKSFIKVRITFFFFKLLKMIKRNLESYYGPFLKERNVFYRVPSINNFPKFSMGFRGPENGQIKSYSSLKMGPGCFLCL